MVTNCIYNRLAFIFILLFIATYNLNATSPQEQFEQANGAFQKGQFQKAIEIYEGILATDNASGELHYNLANAYFKTKQLGKAILHYERSLLLAPNDADTKYNLDFAQKQQIDDLDKLTPFFLKRWWRLIYQTFSSTVWGVLSLLSLWLSIGGFILWLLGNNRNQKKKGFISGLLLFLLSLFLFSAANSNANLEINSGQAILLEEKIKLRNGPDESSTSILEIHEGLKMELLDKIGTWHKVKLSNGEQGWLPETAIEEI